MDDKALNESCGSCGADIGQSLEFPFHGEDEDCRAVRGPISNDGPTHWEVYSTVEGALDETRTTTLEQGHPDAVADALASQLEDAAKLQGFTEWEVFILPHYCGGRLGGCECVQYLTDHKPYLSSGDDNA